MKVKKRHLLSFLMMFLIWNSSNSQIIINQDTISGIWGPNKIYIIKKDLRIPASKTLTIQKGVTVKLSSGVRITVNGKLIALGTQTDSVKFLPETPDAHWNNITFKNTGSPSFQYCVFEGTEKLAAKKPDDLEDLFGALNFGLDTDFDGISDCTFRNNASGAIYIGSIVSDEITIKNIKIQNGENFGVTIHGGNYNKISFENNSITGLASSPVGFTGIKATNLNALSISFQGNSISNARIKYDTGYGFWNHPGGAVIVESPGISDIFSVTFKNDNFFSSTGKKAAVSVRAKKIVVQGVKANDNFGALGGGCYLNGDEIDISGSEFSRNGNVNTSAGSKPVNYGGGGLAIEFTNPGSVINVTDTRFAENLIRDYHGGGLRIIGESQGIEKISILKCRFTDNFSNFNGGAVAVSGFDAINQILFEQNTFEGNSARGPKGGSGIWMDQVKSVNLFTVQESPSVKNHFAEFGNGGFLSINGVTNIAEFRFWKNHHTGFAKTGSNGGLIFLEVDQMDFLNFKENTGISGEAAQSGGILYSGHNSLIGKILFSANQIVKSKALNGEGGSFFLNPGNFTSLQFVGNSIDSTYAKGSGGLLFFNYVSGNDMAISDNPFVKYAKSDASGGNFYIFGTLGLKNSFTFDNNSFKESEAKGDGGVLYFYGNMPRKETPLLITNNNVTVSSVSKGKGGFAFLAGLINQPVLFKGNNVQATTADSDGGFAFLGSNAVQAEKLVFSGNKISNASSTVNETGGILSGTGSVKIIEVEGNRINKASSLKSGGGIFWKNSVKNDFPSLDVVVRQNRITGLAQSIKASGGFMYLESDTVTNMSVKDNYFEKTSASLSGGGFCFKSVSKGIAELTFTNDTVKSALASLENGGFASFQTPSVIGTIIMDSNLFSEGEFKAGLDGGIFMFSAGKYQKLTIERNRFTGVLKASNGGFLCMYGNIPNNSLSKRITILNNKVEARAEVSNNGGFIHLSGNKDQSFIFKGNDFNKQITAGNKGGIISIRNGSGDCDSILISGNNFMPVLLSDMFKAKTGSIIHYEGTFKNRVFQFSNNKVKQTRADSAGSVIFIRNDALTGIQNNCLISENEFDNLSAEVNGAVISQNGFLKDKFIFRDNTVKNILLTGSKSNGGAIYINIGDEKKIKSLAVLSNKAQTFTSTYGGGTFLKFEGAVIDSASIKKNNIKAITSKLTGAFDFDTDTIFEFSSISNQINGVKGQKGALYYLSGNAKAYLRNYFTQTDTLNMVQATGDGGAVLLNLPDCENITLDKAIIKYATSGATGGFLAAQKGISIRNMVFDQVQAENCSAGVNGGFAGITGTFGHITITSNVYINNFASGNGGCYYLESSPVTSGILKVVTSSFKGNQGIISGNGGAFFLESLGNVEFIYNYFRDLKVKTSGGAVHARNFNWMFLDICTFTDNYAKDKNGGALYLDTFYDLVTNNNIFRANVAPGGSGGAYFIREGNIIMRKDSVIGNSAFSGAGGYLTLTGGKIDSVCYKQNNTFDPTNISSYGGGLYVDANKQKQLLLQDSWFYKNNAYRGGGMYGINSSTRQIRSIYAYNLTTHNGAAVFLSESPKTEFINSIFHRNSVVRHENVFPPTAGIHIFNINPSWDSVRIVNSVFNRNNSFALGIEIPVNRKASEFKPAEIMNSILFYNGYLSEEIPQFFGEDSLFSFKYSDVEYISKKVFGNTNINSLPNWLEPNYCLNTKLPFVSPCINQGNPSAMYNDLDGSRNDMGITGGPYAKWSCADTYIRDDNKPVDAEKLENSGFALYPNPTTGKIWVVPGSDIGAVFYIDIISPYGKVLRTEKRNAGFGSKTEIEMGDLPKGLYLLQIRNDKNKEVRKIILM
jgi:hypothetical protein